MARAKFIEEHKCEKLNDTLNAHVEKYSVGGTNDWYVYYSTPNRETIRLMILHCPFCGELLD